MICSFTISPIVPFWGQVTGSNDQDGAEGEKVLRTSTARLSAGSLFRAGSAAYTERCSRRRRVGLELLLQHSRPCDGSHFLPVLLVKGDAATAVILPVDGLSSVVAWQAVRSILEQQASPKPNRVKRTAVPTAEIAHSKGKLLPSLIYISSDHQETNYKVIIGGYLTCKNWSAFCFLYNQ